MLFLAGERFQRGAQGGAGGDAELGVDPVKVGAHRAVGQEQPFGDLFVGQSGRGQIGDLAFLRG